MACGSPLPDRSTSTDRRARRDPRIGATIGAYEILELLGEGGMGVVYKAHDRGRDRIVALKFIAAELTARPAARARFVREAEISSSLEHPHIATFHGLENVDGELALNDLDVALPRGALS